MGYKESCQHDHRGYYYFRVEFQHIPKTPYRQGNRSRPPVQSAAPNHPVPQDTCPAGQDSGVDTIRRKYLSPAAFPVYLQRRLSPGSVGYRRTVLRPYFKLKVLCGMRVRTADVEGSSFGESLFREARGGNKTRSRIPPRKLQRGVIKSP